MRKSRVLSVSMYVALGVALTLCAEAQQAAQGLPKVARITVNSPVTLADNGDSWTLDNGILKATLTKRNGNLTALVYHGVSILTHGNCWEQMPSGTVTARVTIDPATNGGERAEVAVKGINPRSMDIETRFTMERGTSGFYTYDEYTHLASYPSVHVGENRFILEDMNPTFDWLSVDKDRNMLASHAPEDHEIHAKEQSIYASGLYKNSVEHKYSYNALMYKLQAWGWSSTKDHIGVYFMNPSNEYIGGGPDKLDLIDHMTAPGSASYQAIILDYWTSGHYGAGDNTEIPAGQEWKRVVGPIFVYMNTLDNPKDPTQAELDKLTATYGSGMPAVPQVWHDNALTLWNDAVEKSKAEKAAWPFSWVEGVDYPHRDGRATVSGQLVLDDTQAASKSLPNLNVGLTHANFKGSESGYTLLAGNGDIVTWPHDGNYYQFWTEGTTDGRFTIANVRPGTYTLHAFANGVLGEYAKADITVEAGKKIELGKIEWQPVRYGKQVWEIGYPDRTGDKFYKGDPDNYWLWGWGLRYAGLFPNDITYTIGKSDYHKDWFIQEVPHSTTTAWLNSAAKDPYNQRFGWVAIPSSTDDPWPQWGQGRAATWTVKFNMPTTSKGTAVLRIALAGADGGGNLATGGGTGQFGGGGGTSLYVGSDKQGGLIIGVNGKTVGTIHPVATNTLRYNANIKGVWYQYIQKFDASLLKPGANEMTFTVPAGDVTTGIAWDYVRLELNDGSKAYPAPPDNASQRPDYPTLP
ncbi:MAG TPA: polysaccharide lyase family protein [Acidobacteriaceae bacterium]|nr:polysaccharide lyase family protein [Acidobacteriaceae bacterium]